MRVFLGLTEVSGFFSRLKLGFDELGIPCEYVTLHQHRFAYGERLERTFGQRIVESGVAGRLRARHQGARLRYFAWSCVVVTCRLVMLLWVISRFDVIILGAGSSFFGLRELPLLRLLGKKVIYTLHGTDARPPYIDGFFDPVQYGLASLESIDTPDRPRLLAKAHAIVTRKRAQAVRRIERNVAFVVCAPGYSHFLSRPYVNFYAIGLPTVAPAEFSPPRPVDDGRVRILHAPSHLAGKGTESIRAAIEALIAEGLPIDYTEISGQPNLAVFSAIQCCDFVVDQLYSDTPMAGFAAEAAFLGKPAVVGSYYSHRGQVDISPDYMPPSLWCHPESIQDGIRELVTDESKRKRLGIAAHEFVTSRWTPIAVARNLLRILRGRVDEWMINPAEVENLHGCGLPDQVAREQVAAVIYHEGMAMLGLAHNPGLERRYLEFSGHV